jgi:Flp pilus assembly protein TadG
MSLRNRRAVAALKSFGAVAALRRFGAAVAGVSAIEFALLLPLFAGLLFMILQVGLYFYYSTYLAYATDVAARQIMTGAVASQGLTAAQFRTTYLCPALPGGMSCNNIITNVQVVPAGNNGAGWTALTTSTGLVTPAMDNTKTSFCIGNAGSLVAVQVFFAMPVLGIPQMLPGASTFNNQSVVFIQASAAIKNEPFTAVNNGC